MEILNKIWLHMLGVPSFAMFLVAAAVIVIGFLWVYTWVTPQDEFALMQGGRPGAAISLGGALLGFCIVLAVVIHHSHSLIDLAFWALIAMVVQVGAFFVARVWVPTEKLMSGDPASATFLAFFSVAFGLLNAACMTP